MSCNFMKMTTEAPTGRSQSALQTGQETHEEDNHISFWPSVLLLHHPPGSVP